MCGQKRGDKRVQVSGALWLSRRSHRKRDPAIPNQVGAHRPAPPTCLDPRKLMWSPLRYSPWSAPLSSGGGTIIPNPPHHVRQRLRCRVHVLHRAPPTVRRPTACVVVAKPRHTPVPGAWGGERRSVVTLRLLPLSLRLRERGRGVLAPGHARKNSRCGGMRGRSRSRRATIFQYPLESAQAPMMS